jgi:CheY-like chemotaxis protein
LREPNYTVIHVASGLEALRIIRDGTPIALLFTDLVMPGMSGRELAGEAKCLIPEMQMLYTPGCTPSAIAHNGVVDHGVGLLTKPFAYDQLARKVRSVLDSR